MEVISTTGLGKRYVGGRTWALRDLELTIRPGDVFGLVGENGAGKSTLLRLLLRFLKPSAGRVTCPPGVRLGYVPELPAFWGTLTVREQLLAAGRCAGVYGRRLKDAVDRVLRLTDLSSKEGARVNTLSRGMLQRLSIAQAVLPEPQMLVLDEPTAGLDPVGQRGIRDLIKVIHGQGKTILISSHYLVELEEVCTRVGVLHQGRLVLDASLPDLVRQHRHQVQIDLDGDGSVLARELEALELEFQVDGQRVSIHNLDDQRYFTVLSALEQHRLRILALGHPGLLLEQIFVEAARRETR